VLGGVGDKAIDVLHDGGQHCRRGQGLVGEQHNHQARFPVLFGAGVFRFGYAIGEDDQPVAGRERDLSRFVGSILNDSERNAARLKALDGTGGRRRMGGLCPALT
jgi:hypothetical protein